MELKSLKVAPAIHKELKIFIANNPTENMTDFTGLFIMEGLKKRGHKFTKPQKNKDGNLERNNKV